MEKKKYICRCEKRRCEYSTNRGQCTLPSSEGWITRCPPKK